MTEPEGELALPRSILVADDAIYLKILSDPGSVELLEDLEALVIPHTLKAEINQREVRAIRDVLGPSGQLSRNALLVKSPYDATGYESAETALEAFASARYHALGNVVRLLGAREIRVVEAKVDRSTARWDADHVVKIPLGGGGAKVSRKVTKKLAARLDATMAFPGSDPDPEEAMEYMRRRNLANDSQLRDLVELRTGKNPISTYAMTFSGTRESAVNLTSALSIANASPVKLAKVGADFSRTFESISTIEISTTITF